MEVPPPRTPAPRGGEDGEIGRGSIGHIVADRAGGTLKTRRTARDLDRYKKGRHRTSGRTSASAPADFNPPFLCFLHIVLCLLFFSNKVAFWFSSSCLNRRNIRQGDKRDSISPTELRMDGAAADKKYGNKPVNRARIVRKLHNLQKADRSAESNEAVFDQICMLLNQMISAGQDIRNTNDAMWIETILGKFPQEIVEPVLMKMREKEDTTVETVLEMVEAEIATKAYVQARLNSAPIKRKELGYKNAILALRSDAAYFHRRFVLRFASLLAPSLAPSFHLASLDRAAIVTINRLA
ncbi:hypothetical protein OSTOST_24935, partial [Ostertagia ostertagi]